MRYTIEAAVRNHIGKIRKNNEDNFYLNGSYLKREQMDAGGFFAEISSDRRQIYAVCDGMGGEHKGEEASYHVVERILRLDDVLENESDVRTCINAFCDETNRSILSYGQSGHMGTTLVMVTFHENGCEIAHLGDSRVYLLRDRQLTCLTKDHTEVNRLQQMGLISEDEAKNHPDRNMLHKYLGMQNDELIFVPEYTPYQPQAGDRLILCSDGLTDMLTDEQIQDTLLSSRTVTTATKNLINRALEAGGRDNITAMVLSVRKCDDLPDRAPRYGKATRSVKNKHREKDELLGGKQGKRKPVLIAGLLVLILAILSIVLITGRGGVNGMLNLFRNNVKIENSVQIVEETLEAETSYEAPQQQEAEVEQEVKEAEPAPIAEQTLPLQERSQNFVNELIAYGLNGYDEAGPSYSSLIQFSVGYALAHTDVFPQFAENPVTLPASAVAGASNGTVYSAMQSNGCYALSQLQMDEILLQYLIASVPASNDYSNTVYADGTYYVSPASEDQATRVAVVTDFVEGDDGIVHVFFDIFTEVEEEGGASMQLSGNGDATLRQLESGYLGLQLVSLTTNAFTAEPA